ADLGPLGQAAFTADHRRDADEFVRRHLTRLRELVERAGQPARHALAPTADTDAALAALGRGLVVNPVTATALRLAPPLVVTVEEVDEAIARLAGALEEVGACR
ncbi:MAG TPA: hypothetical protein VEP73_03855, partial [Actinomycetota bacterium]|nr:hypothetical protein [Actinomycetota bacterium]